VLPVKLPADAPEKWRAVESALDDNGRTLRLCLIIAVSLSPLLLAAVALLVCAVLGH
jgi:hypothetical protein